MANHVSSLKRARQTTKRTAVNRSNRTSFRSSLRALREALQTGDSSGVIHANTASRYKSRLNARVKAVAASKPASSKPAAAKKSAAR
jgi:small subunit ribosomal protein S20